MENNQDVVRRMIDGKPPLDPNGPPKRKPTSKNRRGFRTTYSSDSNRPKQPPASERSSILAQTSVDAGTERGFSFPYDVNYFARALQAKVERDSEMAPYLAQGKHDQVERWVAKMIERWWAEYVDNSIHSGNAKEFFLAEDWDDVRYYARSCLRAAYLKKHGKKIDGPMYPAQKEYTERLQELHRKHTVDQHLHQVEAEPEDEEPAPLDTEARERLRSFVNKRRKK